MILHGHNESSPSTPNQADVIFLTPIITTKQISKRKEADFLNSGRPPLDAYSIVVLAAKVSIFLGIFLVIAVTLYTVKMHYDDKLEMQGSLAELYRRGIISQPISNGMMDNGTLFKLRASTANNENAPTDYNRVFENFDLELLSTTRQTTSITANFAYQNTVADRFRLLGQVEVGTSEGATLTTQELLIDFVSRRAETTTSVKIENIDSTLHAGKLTVIDFNTSEELLVFSNGVDVVFDENLNNQ